MPFWLDTSILMHAHELPYARCIAKHSKRDSNPELDRGQSPVSLGPHLDVRRCRTSPTAMGRSPPHCFVMPMT